MRACLLQVVSGSAAAGWTALALRMCMLAVSHVFFACAELPTVSIPEQHGIFEWDANCTRDCRDVSILIMEQILLYRDTRESILAGTDAEAWRHMLPAAREKALQAEMKAESNLHPALYPPSEDGSAILGHYKVCASCIP
jgi:hypothetical protein